MYVVVDNHHNQITCRDLIGKTHKSDPPPYCYVKKICNNCGAPDPKMDICNNCMVTNRIIEIL